MASAVANIAMIYNVGAVCGAVIFGSLSQRAGRRREMMVALVLSLVAIPFWAFGQTLPVLIVARFHADGRAGGVGRDSRAPE